MLVNINVNGKKIQQEIEPDLPLLDFLRANGCYSVKRGCETSNCGLCTVFLNEKPVLSCSILAARADGSSVTTLEGLQEEAEEFVAFIADQGAEQCGFCNPGFVMNAIALFRENPQAAGADFVGGEELIPKIQNEGWLDFDVVVATPDMMGVVGRLGRVLGPKGLMPNPKAGTVTMDVTKAINDIKAGKIEYRLDKTNIIHVPVGKASFTSEQLSDNFQALMGAINKAKPASLKGQYIKSATITSTMGPGVKLNVVKIAQ